MKKRKRSIILLCALLIVALILPCSGSEAASKLTKKQKATDRLYHENCISEVPEDLMPDESDEDIGKTVENLKGSVAADTVIKEGKLLNGSISEAELRAWTKEIAE